MLTWLQRDTLTFPPLDKAMREPNGLLAAGGDLSPDRLVQAYRHGCFPWFQDGQPILWWSPDPRTAAACHVRPSSYETCTSRALLRVAAEPFGRPTVSGMSNARPAGAAL